MAKSANQQMAEDMGLSNKTNPPKAKAKSKPKAKAKAAAKAKPKAKAKAAAKAKPKAKAKSTAGSKSRAGSKSKAGSKSRSKAKKGCPTETRCPPPPAGDRFVKRRAGKFNGLFDKHAGDGSGRRGAFVRRGDLECGAENGPGVDFMLEILRDSEQGSAGKERRGHYEVWKDRSGNFLVYDMNTATLLGETFLSREEANQWISSGGANEATCKPGDKPARRRAPAASAGATPATVSNPGGRGRGDDGYLRGDVVGRGGSRRIEDRVADLEGRVDGTERRLDDVGGRLVNVENGLARGLEILAEGRNGDARRGGLNGPDYGTSRNYLD